MLTQLSITQFTVVDSLDVSFAEGMTVITGETGAGKSILLDALGLCLGDRADPGAIRPGHDRAEISALFLVAERPAAQRWLASRDLDAGDECLLRRVVTREGRSRAYINGRPATLQDCAELGDLLIEIHGQHAHQALLHKDRQRLLLDSFGGLEKTAERVAALAGQWREVSDTLRELQASQRDRIDREQLLRYQVEELETLALAEGELTVLEDERRKLENADSIRQQASEAIENCAESASRARAALAQISGEIHGGDPIDNSREMLESAAIQLEESGDELRHYLDGCEVNPQRQQEVEKRLEAIYALARKHRVLPEALPELHRDLADELRGLDSSDERLTALQEEQSALHDEYRKTSTKLGKGRRKAARTIASTVHKLLGRLAMSNCHFEVSLNERGGGEPHPHGDEDIAFLVSTNPGSTPQSLAKVASGGELSRIGLAIQVALAGSSGVQSLVFDEVDAGIGGAVAEVVGRLLADMGERAQVFCVTHLPQVAAQGSQHLLVQKQGRGKSVASTLTPLDEEARTREIARMLGGLKMTEQTLAHAREMLAG